VSGSVLRGLDGLQGELAEVSGRDAGWAREVVRLESRRRRPERRGLLLEEARLELLVRGALERGQEAGLRLDAFREEVTLA